ncbi:DUF4440 domain-containing protein [Streptosporangium sp. NPDC000396]|uniref:DUF4440 domain-containing protein n=1 Tax=Streptosporangium sp. NPDC000396 TaxID=3366185 RepID=UPI00368B4B20
MEREAVWAVIAAMYDAYRRGDRAGIDRLLHPEATIWDSADPVLITSGAQLDKVRDARPADGPAETGVHAYDEVIDVWEGVALARYQNAGQCSGLRAGVKARVGRPPGPERALIRAVLPLDVPA